MVVLIYSSEGEFKDNRKEEMFQKVLENIKTEFVKSHEKVYVCYNLKYPISIDMLLIFKKGIFILKLMDYEGDVIGDKIGPWYVRFKNGQIIDIVGDYGERNIFKLCDYSRSSLINFISFKIIVDSWACFKGDSQFMNRFKLSKIAFDHNSHFRVVNENNIIKEIKNRLDYNGRKLSQQEIDWIINRLRLQLELILMGNSVISKEDIINNKIHFIELIRSKKSPPKEGCMVYS